MRIKDIDKFIISAFSPRLEQFKRFMYHLVGSNIVKFPRDEYNVASSQKAVS
jgi:hypothetical protein